LGTPSRKDCVQNFSSFRSYLIIPLLSRISADVFSSTQLIGSSFLSGLASQTRSHQPIYHCVSPDSSIVDNAALGVFGSVHLHRLRRLSQVSRSLFLCVRLSSTVTYC
jgi:hypothetical protein